MTPISVQNRTAEQLKLLNRLQNLANIISTIKPRSPLSAALQSRVSGMLSLSNFSELDLVALINGSGNQFNVKLDNNGVHSHFFSVRSKVIGENIGGESIFVDENYIFFYGIDGVLLEIASDQNFNALISFNREDTISEKSVECVFSAISFNKQSVTRFDRDNESLTRNGEYISFIANGELNYTAGGLVYGWLYRPTGI